MNDHGSYKVETIVQDAIVKALQVCDIPSWLMFALIVGGIAIIVLV